MAEYDLITRFKLSDSLTDLAAVISMTELDRADRCPSAVLSIRASADLRLKLVAADSC